MNRLSFLPLLAALMFCLAACERQKPPAAVAPPPPKVTVAHPLVRNVTQWDEYTGRLEPVERVDVKAQVSGIVETVPFPEGALVNKGDVLLTIDSRIFRAQLENAQAAVEEAKARLRLAQATLELSQNDLKRSEAAARAGSISPEEYDTRRITVTQNEASVAQARAAIDLAESTVKSAALNVEWCTVRAPISGRISNKLITPGNMLTGGPGQTTTITTITSIDPIYCYVDADEAAVLKYQRLARENERISAADQPIAAYMALANETTFPHVGVLDFVDTRLNPSTGTRRCRATFPNPDGTLLPGFFARLRVVGQQLNNALLMMDDCVGTDQDRKYIWVLRPDKTVERRTVTIGPLEGELRVILTGLSPNELVLVNGLSSLAMVRPGGTVDPTTIPMPEHRLPAAAQAAATAPASMAAATQTRPATSPAEAPR